MNYKPTWKDGIIAVLVIIAAFYSCLNSKQSQVINEYQKVSEYKDNKFDSLLNIKNQIVAEKKMVETTSEEVIKSLSAEIFDLKKKDEKRIKQVQTLVRAEQKIRLETLKVPYVDSISSLLRGTLVSADSVVIPPKKFRDSTENYRIDGTVLLEGVIIDRLDITDTISFRIAEQKPKGLFRKITQPNNIVVQTIHSNQLVKTTGLQTLILKQRANGWNRYIKPALVAVITGIVSYKVLK